MRSRFACLLPVFLLAACAGGGDAGDEAPGRPGLSERLGGGPAGTMIPPGANRPVELEENAGTVLDADEIAFTDPDTGELAPEEAALLENAKDREGPWGKSYTRTMKTAMRTGKPVLIWFTDTHGSPNCRALSEELFNRTDFEEWASEEVIRLQVDQSVGEGRNLAGNSAAKAKYVKELKQRYRVMGHPTLLVLTPSGDVIGRYRGYKRGQVNYKWGQLKQGVMLAGEAYAGWKAGMEKKGYRTWSDPRKRTVFAKLAACRDGKVVLVEPDGTRLKTEVRHLSWQDRQWIEEQKRARGH